MPTIAQLIGGAGTGKTTRLLDLMQKCIARGIDPREIGFVSFTRAARGEAETRATEQFGLRAGELARDGWFKTLHSVCYRVLGISGGELLSDRKADREWLQDAIQEPIGGIGGGEDGGLAEVGFEGITEAGQAMNLWAAARNRLEPLAVIWERASDCDDRIPALDFCAEVIRRYEQAKRLDGRCDFVDLLSRFAGYRCLIEGPEKTAPRGDPPELPVWFFDEQQDTSALLDAVCRRLIDPAKWVYVVGDPFQAIYGWAGADPKHFLGWEVSAREVMPISYRCPGNLLDLGESILRECSDYWDRGIKPSDERLAEIETQQLEAALADVDPRQSWLLIARTNREAARLANMLNDENIPWQPTKGRGGWAAPVRNMALRSLWNLQHGGPINGEEWRQALKIIPSKLDGCELLVRGTKKRFSDEEYKAAEIHPWVHAKNIDELGATDSLKQIIASGRWRTAFEDAERYCYAIEKWGPDAIDGLSVRVGTIHSVKGAEADNVLLLTNSTRQIEKGQQTAEGFDEERRVEYVGVTRARQRLILARDARATHRMKISA